MAESSPYGSARLYESGNASGLQVVFDRGGFSGSLLGVNEPGSDTGCVFMPANQRGHACFFGGTGAGKGTTQIIPTCLSYTGSMVVIDPKGENAWASAARRRQLGHRVVLLDPWDEVNSRYGALAGQVEARTKFNPLYALDPNSDDLADDVVAIGDALIKENSTGEHWTDSAKELVAGITAAVVERSPRRATLGDVRKIIASSDADLLTFITQVVKTRPDSVGARKLQRFVKDSREIGSIRSTANTQTGFLDSRRLLESMETGHQPFDLADIARGRVTVYLVLPVDKLETHGRWLRLLLSLTIRAVARQRVAPVLPVLFVCDEMGTIGKLQVIENAFGLMGGMGIRIMAFLQDLTQLQRDYERSWETFIANSHVIVILEATDNTTTQYFSSYMGVRTHKTQSDSYAYQAGVFKSSYGRNGYNKTDTSVPLMLPDDIRRLDPERILIIYTKGNPYLIKRVPYFKEGRWYGMYRPLPGYPAPRPHQVVQPVKAVPPTPDFMDKFSTASVAAGRAAASKATAAAAFASGWIGAKVKEQRQARVNASRVAAAVATDTSERENWAKRLRDAE
jgi:type IV secretion system protein VirD4